MAAMTTVLTPHGQSNGWTVYRTPTHTAEVPFICQQKKVTKEVQGELLKDYFRVALATDDSDGNRLAGKVAMEVVVLRPVGGQSADVTTVRDLFREFIASDEFADMVTKQALVA